MKIAPVAEVKAHFSAYLRSSADGLVVVTRNGKPAAVLLGITDGEEIERLSLAYSPRFRRVLEESRAQVAAGKGVPHEEFWSDPDAS
jgi:prevent-host-death family protein